jgi:cation transport regulator ChaC
VKIGIFGWQSCLWRPQQRTAQNRQRTAQNRQRTAD